MGIWWSRDTAHSTIPGVGKLYPVGYTFTSRSTGVHPLQETGVESRSIPMAGVQETLVNGNDQSCSLELVGESPPDSPPSRTKVG